MARAGVHGWRTDARVPPLFPSRPPPPDELPGRLTSHPPTHPPTLPPQVEYAMQDMGYLRFYLAPKIEDEDMEGEDEAP